MIIKEQVQEFCDKCGHHVREVSMAEYGCDECGQSIVFDAQGDGYLEVTVQHHDHDKEAGRLTYCSWACVFKGIPKIEKGWWFLSLPFVHATGIRNIETLLAEVKP